MFSGKSDLEVFKHLPNGVELTIHYVSDQNDDRLHDKLDEATRKLSSVSCCWFSGEFFCSWVEVVITPKFLHKLGDVELELFSVNSGKSLKSEGPTKKC